jgi:hypothetical protein
MAYVAKTFDNFEELVDYLNDIARGKLLPASSRVYGLDGLTLIINDGVADRTVTFADADGTGLLPKEILAQIAAAHANLGSPNVGFRNYGHAAPPRVALAVLTSGYTVDKDGTANTILGFSTTADKVVGANAVASANIVAVNAHDSNRVSVLHE